VESFEVVESLAGVEAAEWNELAGPQPFVRHEFLSALIECGCAAARSGWLPQFLLLRRAGALVGAMPMFAKSHSYGTTPSSSPPSRLPRFAAAGFSPPARPSGRA
jgi:predicted N-acyltransferase